jgi:hypothetical protein
MTAKLSPNQNDAGPIVRRNYGTPDRGRLWHSLGTNQDVCSDASNTEM